MSYNLPKPRLRLRKPFSWLDIKAWYCTSSHPWARTWVQGSGDTPEKAYAGWKEKWEMEANHGEFNRVQPK